MADEIYIITASNSKDKRITDTDEEGNFDVTQFFYDEGNWVEAAPDSEELTGVGEYLGNESNLFVIMFVPYSAVTFDENQKITSVKLP
jgi:hypothetical protein